MQTSLCSHDSTQTLSADRQNLDQWCNICGCRNRYIMHSWHCGYCKVKIYVIAHGCVALCNAMMSLLAEEMEPQKLVLEQSTEIGCWSGWTGPPPICSLRSNLPGVYRVWKQDSGCHRVGNLTKDRAKLAAIETTVVGLPTCLIQLWLGMKNVCWSSLLEKKVSLSKIDFNKSLQIFAVCDWLAFLYWLTITRTIISHVLTNTVRGSVNEMNEGHSSMTLMSFPWQWNVSKGFPGSMLLKARERPWAVD